MAAAKTGWIGTEATVTSCRFQFRAGSALGFGVQLGEKFRITFDYRAHGRLYSDEFQSPKAIPQDTHLPVSYNPLAPEQNSLSNTSTATGRPPVVLIGIAGSALLLLLWVLALRGCS